LHESDTSPYSSLRPNLSVTSRTSKVPTADRIPGDSSRPHRPHRIFPAVIIIFIAGAAATAPEPAPQPAPPTPYEEALAMYRAGRFRDAATLRTKTLQTSPDSPAGYQALLGWCRYRLGDMQAALDSFREAVRTAPDNADALEGVARSAAR